MYKDKYGEIIYVGKAISLRNRVRSYFRSTERLPVKVQALVKEIDEFEYIIVGSEMEALILENNLIKKNMPRFNVLLRDDKTYPYIKVTTNDDFARVVKTRRVVNDGGKYFGPYTDVGAVNQLINLINKLYPIKKCSSRRFPKGFKPCLNYHIGLCPGICLLYEGSLLTWKSADTVAKNLETVGVGAGITDVAKGNASTNEKNTSKDVYGGAGSEWENCEAFDEEGYPESVDSFEETADGCTASDERGCDGASVCVEMGEAGQKIRACYDQMAAEILDFLHGRFERVEKLLRERMDAAATALDFERAAKYRDDLLSLDILREKQKIVTDPKNDIDIVVSDEVEDGTNIMVFFIRSGKLIGRESYKLNPSLDENREEQTVSFIKQYYSEASLIPRDILVESDNKEYEIISEWLSALKGSKVKISVPQRGEKKALLDMALENITKTRETFEKRMQNEADKTERLKAAFSTVITGEEYAGRSIERIEAYDISNTSGVDSVGVMVVFEHGKKRPKDYRKFKIKTVEGPNDYGSLQEVIYRRLSEYIKARESGAPNGFEKKPDLLLIDGGEKQAAAVEAVVDALKLDIPVAGMVKDDKHRTEDLVFKGVRAGLDKRGELYKFIYFIQEEVHRFAIDYHKNLRDKRVTGSVLDNITGVGEKRRNALLSHFGSVEAIRNASVEELAGVTSMNRKAAEAVLEFLKEKND